MPKVSDPLMYRRGRATFLGNTRFVGKVTHIKRDTVGSPILPDMTLNGACAQALGGEWMLAHVWKQSANTWYSRVILTVFQTHI